MILHEWGCGKLLANHQYEDEIKSDDDKVKTHRISHYPHRQKLNGYIKWNNDDDESMKEKEDTVIWNFMGAVAEK